MRWKKAVESIKNREDHTKKDNELENNNLEMIQVEKERKLIFLKNERTQEKLSNSIRKDNGETIQLH